MWRAQGESPKLGCKVRVQSLPFRSPKYIVQFDSVLNAMREAFGGFYVDALLTGLQDWLCYGDNVAGPWKQGQSLGKTGNREATLGS